MEDGRSSGKRKVREGENTHSAQQTRAKKRKKQKKHSRNEEEEQRKPSDATAASSRDQATLMLKRDKKKPKICGEEGEEQVCEAKKKGNTAAHLPYYLKEHSQGQKDDPHHADINHDADAVCYRTKQERKKVRFSDQFTTCKCPNQSHEDRGRCHGVFEEPTENGCAEEASPTASCSCNTEKSKEVPAQDELTNSYAGRVEKATDERSLSAFKSHKDDVDEVWGKRFSPEEDELLKNAVFEYLKSKGWDEQEGLNKVFNSQKHKDARNCWADIKLALPHRPRAAVRYRAHLLLEKGAHAGKWSEEEEQLLKRLQGEHGRKWKVISSLIDRHRTSIKEKWRSLRRMKGKGVWTQGELQQLSDLVHKCLRAKALLPVERKRPDRHILRDDINWEMIADTIGTHNHGSCCGKWYYNLQSSLVTDGLWANEDDLLLLESLLESGACTEEEVEWDSLLNHRSGQVCFTRWKQMVKQLGENRTQQFLDKLDILARRYAPELLEASVTESPSVIVKISDS